MATYSSKSDVKDPLLAGVSQESDHAEAEREINRELRRIGVDPEAIDDEEILKEMSVYYACAQRCLYETKDDGDAFDTKRPTYERRYRDILSKLDASYAAGAVDVTGGDAFRSLTVERA